MDENKEQGTTQEHQTPQPKPKNISCCHKLNSFNWLADISQIESDSDIVEIRFKNTRKGFFRNVNNLRLEVDDIVAVEASPGHDIGRVSMVGRLVYSQLKQARISPDPETIKKVYRKAKMVDLEKWDEARSQEVPTMLKSRKITEDLKLNMKIGDVEYQGDKTKAVFYYIANERVDFRELIKVLAEQFRVRIEMRQIGARQEAGRIGGIGSCGRELCCASYITNFVSVTTAYARHQDLSLNPQKLAGQCGKLKCCLNYELDSYFDKQKNFPSKEALHLMEGTAYFVKMEVYKEIYWYSFDQNSSVNMTAVPVSRVIEIQKLNRKGNKPQKLTDKDYSTTDISFSDVVGDESLTRFDKKNEKRPKKNRGKRRNRRNERRQ